MSSNEVWVVIVLALVGYWGTSAFIRFFKKESDWTKNQSKSDSNKTKDKPKQEQAQHPSPDKSWYEILEVDPSSSLDEIKLAYKKKISMYHPDKVSNMGPEFNEIAQRKSKEINSAYDEAFRLKS
jgi:preprotein translocase subunit Sec63